MNPSHDEVVSQIAEQVREVARTLPFEQRANLVRETAKAVRDTVKFDVTGGGAPEGASWELDGLATVCDAAEDYYYAALDAKQGRGR